jgi:RNA 2',3'-cyclic 3'-phosphodiesterase
MTAVETYRLFIAAELPPAVKAALAAAQERLRYGNPPVKWVAPEAMHLTLRFLGDTDAALLPPLGAAVRATLVGYRSMTLHLTTAGAFPNERRPSVVWAGVGGATAALGQAQAAIESAVELLGFPREPRPFHVHLTLGRVRRDATPAQQMRLGESIRALPPFAPAPWSIERVILFRSELRSDGPIYTEIADCRLQIAD